MKTIILAVSMFLLSICCYHKIYGQMTGLIITGDPEDIVNGATWTYTATVDGVVYDLRGILFKPSGDGPFPSVIINHGTGGSATSYSKKVAQEMVTWGYVCIATNYTHSGGVPCGSPGNCTCPGCPSTTPCSCLNWGASNDNILRGMKCWDILASLEYVNESCIMAFGHSRGAWLTTALVASNPTKFKAAGHTAGGATTMTGTNAPTATVASQITCPYIAHHGKTDKAVALAMDSLLYNVFEQNGVTHELYVYETFADDSYCTNPDDQHCLVSFDATMFDRTKKWFDAYKCPGPTLGFDDIKFIYDKPVYNSEYIDVFPNPAADGFTIETKQLSNEALIRCFNSVGELIFTKGINDGAVHVNSSGMKPGIYMLHVLVSDKLLYKSILIR